MSGSKVMVLTGSASGMGRHLTGALLARGHRVIATDLREDALREAARVEGWDASRTRLEKIDVRRAEEWESVLDAAQREFGGVDVLFNIAGVLKPGWVTELKPADVDFHIDVNTKGTILGTHAAAVRMVKAGGGHIVNFGSLASMAPVPGLSLYSASKFAVRGFSLAAAMELRSKGVAVTVVMPDAVETPMLDLQVDYDEAAMTFSGPRALTVKDVERVIVEEVLPKRPLEVALPLSRGLLARTALVAPGLAGRLRKALHAKGRKRQEEIKKGRG